MLLATGGLSSFGIAQALDPAVQLLLLQQQVLFLSSSTVPAKVRWIYQNLTWAYVNFHYTGHTGMNDHQRTQCCNLITPSRGKGGSQWGKLWVVSISIVFLLAHPLHCQLFWNVYFHLSLCGFAYTWSWGVCVFAGSNWCIWNNRTDGHTGHNSQLGKNAEYSSCNNKLLSIPVSQSFLLNWKTQSLELTSMYVPHYCYWEFFSTLFSEWSSCFWVPPFSWCSTWFVGAVIMQQVM